MQSIAGLIKSGAWLTFASIISKLTNAFALPLLARLIAPESLGIYSIITSLAQSAEGFSNLGITIAMQRNGSQYNTLGVEAVGRLFGVGFALISTTNICTAIGIYLWREALAQHWFNQTHIVEWLGAGAILISLQPLANTPLIFLASLQEFRAYAIRSSVGTICTSIITVILCWRFGLEGAIAGLIVGAIFQIGWNYAIVKPALHRRNIRLRFDRVWREIHAILKLGFPYYCGNTLLGSLVSLPLMGLVSQYGGLTELGYLRVAQSMAALIGFIPSAIAPAAISYLSANLADDPNSYHQTKSIYLRGNWILLLIPTGIISLIIPELINVIFGRGYQQAEFLAWLTMWLSMMAGVTTILIQYLVVLGKTITIAYSSFVGICCLVITAFILVPHYHGTGFLIAQLIGQLVGFLLVFKPGVAELQIKDRQLLDNLIYLSIITFIWTLAIVIFKFRSLIKGMTIVATIAILLILVFKNTLQQCEQTKIATFIAKFTKLYIFKNH